MKRLVIMVFMAVCLPWTAVCGQGDWMGSLNVGVAIPASASGNAPELSTAMTAGLRLHCLVGRTPLFLTAMVDGVHWLTTHDPDHLATPLDRGMYTNRFMFFPFTAGVGFIGGLGHGMAFNLYATVGGYWRNIICRQMSAPGVMDAMNESGWGFACKFGFDFYMSKHWMLGVSYLRLGNPSGDGGEALPAGAPVVGYGSFLTGPDNDVAVTVRRFQPSLEGYGQGFLFVTLGYNIF